MGPLAPGTLLQHRYLRRRLQSIEPDYFIEVGVGEGYLSRLLLDLGWRGEGWDLNSSAGSAVGDARGYELHVGDWLAAPEISASLVIASMVIEHFNDSDEHRFLERCAKLADLTIVFVPASPAHWGIEDEIAGHHRRYTRRSLEAAIEGAGLRLVHVAALTFPLSNLLLPLSNRLVARSEGKLVELGQAQRTALSGVRDVPLKTRYPSALRVLLNDFTLTPFYLAQLATRHSDRALVLYGEGRRRRSVEHEIEDGGRHDDHK